MPGMMRRDAAFDNRVPVAMLAYLGALRDELLHDVAPRFTLLSVMLAPRERSFRRCLIAATARRQKDNGRKKIVRLQCRQKLRGRHLGHAQFQSMTPLQ